MVEPRLATVLSVNDDDREARMRGIIQRQTNHLARWDGYRVRPAPDQTREA